MDTIGDSTGSSYVQSRDAFNVYVAVRLRPDNIKELKRGCIPVITDVTPTSLSVVGTRSSSVIRDKQGPDSDTASQHFAFDAVYSEETSQYDVAKPIADRVIPYLLQGVSASVMAYGTTGSGKTYTMLGSDVVGDNDKHIGNKLDGVSPVCINSLFEEIEKSLGNKSVSVFMSMFEIYCEGVYDLLARNSKSITGSLPNLSVKENNKDGLGVVVEGLSERPIVNAKVALKLLEKGMAKRTQFNTVYNEHSSRSHALIRLRIVIDDPGTVFQQKIQYTHEATRTTSVLTLVDLAGSERFVNGEEDGIMVQQRIREAQNINRSLLSLKQCMDALAKEGRGHIPFRDSKLTLILKGSLMSGCNILIANVVQSVLPKKDGIPHRTLEEVLNTLKYAQTARSVVTSAKRHIEALERHIDEYRAEIIALRSQLVIEMKKNEALESLIPQKLKDIGKNDEIEKNMDEKNEEESEEEEINEERDNEDFENSIEVLKQWVEKEIKVENRKKYIIKSLNEILRLKQLIFLANSPNASFRNIPDKTLKLLLLELTHIEMDISRSNKIPRSTIRRPSLALFRLLILSGVFDSGKDKLNLKIDATLNSQANKAIKILVGTFGDIIEVACANEDIIKRRTEVNKMASELITIINSECPLIKVDGISEAVAEVSRAIREKVTSSSSSTLWLKPRSKSAGAFKTRIPKVSPPGSTVTSNSNAISPESTPDFSNRQTSPNLAQPSGRSSTLGSSSRRSITRTTEESSKQSKSKEAKNRATSILREQTTLRSKYDLDGRCISRSRSLALVHQNRADSASNTRNITTKNNPYLYYSPNSNPKKSSLSPTREVSSISPSTSAVPKKSKQNFNKTDVRGTKIDLTPVTLATGHKSSTVLKSKQIVQAKNLYSSSTSSISTTNKTQSKTQSTKTLSKQQTKDEDKDKVKNIYESKDLMSTTSPFTTETCSFNNNGTISSSGTTTTKGEIVPNSVLAHFPIDSSFTNAITVNSEMSISSNSQSMMPSSSMILPTPSIVSPVPEVRETYGKKTDEQMEIQAENEINERNKTLKEKKEAEIRKLEEEINKRLKQRKLEKEKKEKELKEQRDRANDRLKKSSQQLPQNGIQEPFIALTEALYTAIKKRLEKTNNPTPIRPPSSSYMRRISSLDELIIYEPDKVDPVEVYGTTLNYKELISKKQTKVYRNQAKNPFADLEMNSWDSDDERLITETGGASRPGSASRMRRPISRGRTGAESLSVGKRPVSRQTKNAREQGASGLVFNSRRSSRANSRVASPATGFRPHSAFRSTSPYYNVHK